MRNFLLLFSLLAALSFNAHARSWETLCKTFTEDCLFLLATNEAHNVSAETTLYYLAFHAGRLGLDEIPGGDMAFASERVQSQARNLLDLGKAVSAGSLSLSLEHPLTGFKELLVAPYLLPASLADLSQSDVEEVLALSGLSPGAIGTVVGKVMASDLHDGKYRFVNGQFNDYVDFLQQFPDWFLSVTSLVISLAEEGYTSEAKDITHRYLAPEDHIRAQDVLLYVEAIQSMFGGEMRKGVSLATAIQSPVLRLESLGHLVALTEDSFIGEHYLSALYDSNYPLSRVERRNILLFTLSLME